MRNSVAKKLRALARAEMAQDKAPDRDLVWGRTSVINSPQSVRAMYLQLKSAWVFASRRTSQHKHPVADGGSS